jgi:2-methylcitrate dehydratase PrpD
MSGAAGRLVDHALALNWSAVPARAQAAALAFLHDTLCVGAAGSRAENSHAIAGAAALWSGQPGAGCSVLGRPGVRHAAPYAAFLNAFQIHAQEFDCVHEAAVAHPMASVTAVLLAEAQRSGPYTGADFLGAMVAGIDIVATLGIAVTSPLRFFRPATAGIFGAVGALCRLRRLDRETSLDAFGYALAFASGTMQAHVEGKPALALQVGAAARSAVEAVDLAAAGLAGPRASIDGPYGYLALFETAHRIEDALAMLGRAFRVSELSWKPFPTGRAAHGAIVAVQILRDTHGLRAGSLQRLVYRAPPLIQRLVGRGSTPDMAVAHARLCLPYVCAVALDTGSVGLDDFSAARRADGHLQDLAARFTVEADDNPNPSAFVPAVAIAELTDGSRIEVPVQRQFGAPDAPPSPAQFAHKARACLAFAGMALAHEPLAAAMSGFAGSRDCIAQLAPLLGTDAGEGARGS